MIQSTNSFSIPSGAPNEIRLILVGKTDAGKISFGNTIFSSEMFKEVLHDPNSVTTKCTIGCRFFDEKQIFIVDTHDFLDTTATDEAMRSEVASIV